MLASAIQDFRIAPLEETSDILTEKPEPDDNEEDASDIHEQASVSQQTMHSESEQDDDDA